MSVPGHLPAGSTPWRPLALAGVATLLVCLGLMRWVDIPLALYVHSFEKTTLTRVFAVITELGNGVIWYALALIGMAAARIAERRQPSPQATALLRRRLRAGMFLIVSLAASGLLINGLKLVIGRARPPALFDTGAAHFYPLSQLWTSWSFPSGHSQSIWAAMIATAWIFPALRLPCVTLAILVSVSRVIVSAHFLSDIIAGAFLAVAVAVLIRRLFERGGVCLNLSLTDADVAARPGSQFR